MKAEKQENHGKTERRLRVMIELKRKIIMSAASLFTLVGTVAAAKPICMGWF
jgi:hypothetical protein